MNNLTEAVVSILTAIVGVAILSVLVSRKSNTAAVIQSLASGFGNALGVAVSPVSGATVSPNLTYPGNVGGLSNFSGLSMPTLYS